MIHTDGHPTLVSSGFPDARLAAVFGMSKPLIVEDAMRREIEPHDAAEDFAAMNYGAWRALNVVRTMIQEAERPMTGSEILTVMYSLELTYEGLYRAAAEAR